MISSNSANAFSAHYLTSKDIFNIDRSHKFLNILPPFLAFGTFACTHMPLCNGFEVILFPDSSPNKLPELIIKYKPNHFCCGPLHLTELMKNKTIQNMDLSFIYSAIYGGENQSDEWQKMISDFLRSHGSKYSVINGYGMTEAAGAICTVTHKVEMLITYAKNVIKIVDPDTGDECKYNNSGEILVSTPTMMMGYYKNTDETNKVIFEENGIRWLRTGDLGQMSEDGKLTITGRLKRIYWKKSGDAIVRVYPMRIEDELSTFERVERCTVVGKKDDTVGFQSIAFIILKDKSANTEAVKSTLDELCRDNLTESHIPDEYGFVDDFPLTRAGQVDYRALEKMAEGKGE